MDTTILQQTAKELVAGGKGILAADWSLSSSEKHFAKNSIEHTEEERRKYRQMLFTTPGLEEFISGVIFFDETFRQKYNPSPSSGQVVSFPEFLLNRGIIPGIKVDLGSVAMSNFPEELVTEGLDGLRGRLAEYKNLGARFTKWRAAFVMGRNLPTKQCITSNSEAMARYAALSQEADMVPIVEPENLMEGDHGLKRSEEVTKEVLFAVFNALERHKVHFPGCVLKTNYVHPGSESQETLDYQKVAEATLRVLEKCVPHDIPGVVFLSGGDGPEEATKHLNDLAKIAKDVPWKLTFSYARALQYPAISIWAGRDENVQDAQKTLYHRAKLNSLASKGEYEDSVEEEKDA